MKKLMPVALKKPISVKVPELHPAEKEKESSSPKKSPATPTEKISASTPESTFHFTF